MSDQLSLSLTFLSSQHCDSFIDRWIKFFGMISTSESRKKREPSTLNIVWWFLMCCFDMVLNGAFPTVSIYLSVLQLRFFGGVFLRQNNSLSWSKRNRSIVSSPNYICRYGNGPHHYRCCCCRFLCHHCVIFWEGKSIGFLAWLIIEIIHFYNFLSMPCTYNRNVRRLCAGRVIVVVTADDSGVCILYWQTPAVSTTAKTQKSKFEMFRAKRTREWK